jgi:hypothetical protein
MGVPGGVPLFEKEVAPFIKKPKILINPAGFITPWGCCFFFKVALFPITPWEGPKLCLVQFGNRPFLKMGGLCGRAACKLSSAKFRVSY